MAGKKVRKGMWPGHLVVIVPFAYGKLHAMIDMTIEQANRPKRGIVLAPLCVRVTDEFVLRRQPAAFTSNKSLLVYHLVQTMKAITIFATA